MRPAIQLVYEKVQPQSGEHMYSHDRGEWSLRTVEVKIAFDAKTEDEIRHDYMDLEDRNIVSTQPILSKRT